MIKEGRYIDTYETMSENPDKFNHLNSFSIIPKQLTIKQLEQGLYWLLWKFYDMENLAERIRIFFDNYSNSPKKDKLHILKSKIDFEKLGIVWRLFKHYLTRCSAYERNAMKKMARYARESGTSPRA